MAPESKPAENKDKSNDDEVSQAADTTESETPQTPESTDESPLILEAEATEVSEMPEDVATDEAAAESEAATGDESNSAAIAPIVSAPVEQASPAQPFLAFVLGGLLAGGLGYFAATQFQPQPPSFDSSALTDSISQNAASIEEISARIENIDGALVQPDLASVEALVKQSGDAMNAKLAELSASQAELSSAFEAIEARNLELAARLNVIEAAGAEEGGIAPTVDIEAFREEVARMTADAEARLEETQQKVLEAEQAAAAAQAAADAEIAKAEAEAARQAALVDLKVAVESGAAYSDLLDAIDGAPDALAVAADTGIPTIGDLQRGYPMVARAALAAAEAPPGDASAGQRFTAFLKRQTNARSLTPQEGQSVDAILSRAEGHIGNGDLDAALAELDALSDDGKAAMSSWLEQANTRAAALDALRNLTATN